MTEKAFVCSKVKLMVYLVRHGFDFFKIRQDEENSNRVVFLFDNTKELKKAIAEYYGD